MKYLFETHMHTCEISKCARSTGAEMARTYYESGYSGIVVTDHFLNGNNTTVPHGLPWRERVDLFLSGYLNAKTQGDKLGLTVLLGWEFSQGADLMTYGLSCDFLYDNPDIDKLSAKDYITLVKKSGGFLIHAHPFRGVASGSEIRLFPEVDAVEIVNGAHKFHLKNPEPDRRAYEYAKDTNKIMTVGSDAHDKGSVRGLGVLFHNEIKSNEDFIKALREGCYEINK